MLKTNIAHRTGFKWLKTKDIHTFEYANQKDLLFGMCVLMHLVAQTCLTLCNPMDCSPTGSSLHGDSPGKNTGVGCHALIQEIFPTQRLNPGFPHCGGFFTILATREAPEITRICYWWDSWFFICLFVFDPLFKVLKSYSLNSREIYLHSKNRGITSKTWNLQI